MSKLTNDFDPTLDASNFLSNMELGPRDFILMGCASVDERMASVLDEPAVLGLAGFRGNMEAFGLFIENLAKSMPKMKNLSMSEGHTAELKFIVAIAIAQKVLSYYHPELLKYISDQVVLVENPTP